ncbi:MAG: D-sedoheptulose 7-phosphate isomerase [Nanoarchaeota archaeon]|nr:D-sedoheptulose 7-phosphate isomerase [Nanoarchaeota archaeon]
MDRKAYNKEIDLSFEDSIKAKKDALSQKENILNSVEMIVACIKTGNKVLICGNGGSAADAQHIAAELVGRFIMERKGYPAIALTTDTSILTAWGNDYNFDTVFSRQVEALGKENDVLIAITTSGSSKNIIEAIKKAKSQKMKIIGLLGKDGGQAKSLCDIPIIIPSKITARIQEGHMLIYHIMCELIEKELK